MGPAAFIMVVIGCNQGQACAPVVTLPIAYRTEARCLAERTDIVAATEGLGYDRLYAECRKRPIGDSASAPVKSIPRKPLA